jgi:hypothetical protein
METQKRMAGFRRPVEVVPSRLETHTSEILMLHTNDVAGPFCKITPTAAPSALLSPPPRTCPTMRLTCTHTPTHVRLEI